MAVYEGELGIPRVLARLADQLFEGMSAEARRSWTVRFAEAVPVGADLSSVWGRFALRLLSDPERGVAVHARPHVRPAVERVGALYARQVAGETIPWQEWKAAADAAAADGGVADAYDADAAAAAATPPPAPPAPPAAGAYAAYAYAGAYAGAYAAGVYAADAAAAARSDHYEWQAGVLLELMAAAPVGP
jgi:hypothetical protein